MESDVFYKLICVPPTAYATFNIISLLRAMCLLGNYQPLDGRVLISYSPFLSVLT